MAADRPGSVGRTAGPPCGTSPPGARRAAATVNMTNDAEVTVAGNATNDDVRGTARPVKDPMDKSPKPRRNIILPARGDGMLLRGTLFRPEADPENIRGVITIHGATGRSEKSYEPMARRFTERGYAVVTYCYRGLERSGLESDTRNDVMAMTDWITQDAPGAMEWAREHFPDVPVYALGHGAGGHGVLWSGSEGLYDAAVLVGVGTRGLRAITGLANRVKLFTLLTIVCPVTAETMGRIPRQPFGFEVEPPVGVVRQWARWARHRDYFFGDSEYDFAARFARANGRYLSVRILDDQWCNQRGSDEITDRMFGAEVEKRVLEPGDGSIGHAGILAAGNEESWDGFVDWFEED